VHHNRPGAALDHPEGNAMCKCIEEIDKKLLEAGKNTRIGTTWNFMTGVEYAAIRTEKVDPKNRLKPSLAIPTFCPWCGERYAPPETTTEPQPQG
jgi:hypothetical protein